jgi:hypothetical protein
MVKPRKTTEHERVGHPPNLDGTPVAREVDAMDDIQGASGIRPSFLPYNTSEFEGHMPTTLMPGGLRGNAELPTEVGETEIPLDIP